MIANKYRIIPLPNQAAGVKDFCDPAKQRAQACEGYAALKRCRPAKAGPGQTAASKYTTLHMRKYRAARHARLLVTDAVFIFVFPDDNSVSNGNHLVDASWLEFMQA